MTLMWRPWKVDCELKRFGPKHDGGYVMPNTLFGAKAILGYGVDKDVSFENELTETFDVPAWVFDHTITEVPDIGKRVTYVKEGITGLEETNEVFNLKTHVDRYVGPDDNFVLKMDVEGHEWGVFLNSDLSRVTVLIAELHNLEVAPLHLIEKLHETFCLVHIHGNNCHNQPVYWVDRARRMPRYVECTWVRKDLVTIIGPSTESYPTPLDVINRGDVPDVNIDVWKTIEKPFTFIAPDEDQRRILAKYACPEDKIISDYEPGDVPDYTFILRSGDIVPIEIIGDLNNLTTSDVGVVHMQSWFRGNYTEFQPRIILDKTKKQVSSTMKFHNIS